MGGVCVVCRCAVVECVRGVFLVGEWNGAKKRESGKKKTVSRVGGRREGRFKCY